MTNSEVFKNVPRRNYFCLYFNELFQNKGAKKNMIFFTQYRNEASTPI